MVRGRIGGHDLFRRQYKFSTTCGIGTGFVPRMRFTAALRRARAKFREAARFRIMTYALIASVACGATGFLQPIDDFIRNVRFLARDVPADGTIAVIGIDEKSLKELGGRWPWPRSTYADVIAAAKKAGARRVIYDGAMADSDDPESEKALIDVFKRYPGDIYLGTTFIGVRNGVGYGQVLPAPALRPHVKIADYSVWYNPIGQPSLVSMETRTGPSRYPAIATVLADQKVVKGAFIRPDYAIPFHSFPYVSASDLVLNPAAARLVAGRDVLIGPVADLLNDTKFLPAQGNAAGVFVHAIAAQTLKRGLPVDWGWAGALLLAAATGLFVLLARGKLLRTLVALCAPAVLAYGPVLLDANNISVEVAPAFLLITIVYVQHARLRLGWAKSRMNQSSGLANVVALRELPVGAGTSLIATKVENYAAIIASFPRDVEGIIVGEIVSRLRLGNDAIQVYQADDGVFYWLSPLSRPDEIGAHLEGLRALFRSAILVHGRRVDVSLAFGIDTDSSRSMSSRTGSALLCAEEALGTERRWKIYDEKRSLDAVWELSLASEIDRGLDEGQFWLAFQPKLDIVTGKITGAEVLARWAHPDRGAISPADFIPAAERSQRIHRLTRHIVEQAVVAAVKLQKIADCRLAVNISVPVLSQPGFADQLLELVRRYGVSPHSITVEITESVIMTANDTPTEVNLAQLRRDGFGLSIDDFGTGFSTLEYVRRIPAHEMKIDQSFVRKVTTSPADRVIVESIVQMAHQLDRKVVAEGVEDAECLAVLRELGCDEVQGYFVGRPVAFDIFSKTLEEHVRRRAA